MMIEKRYDAECLNPRKKIDLFTIVYLVSCALGIRKTVLYLVGCILAFTTAQDSLAKYGGLGAPHPLGYYLWVDGFLKLSILFLGMISVLLLYITVMHVVGNNNILTSIIYVLIMIIINAVLWIVAWHDDSFPNSIIIPTGLSVLYIIMYFVRVRNYKMELSKND